MGWVKWLWKGLLTLLGVAVGVFTLQVLRRPRETAEDRERALTEAHRRAELEAQEEQRAIALQKARDLAAVDAKKWRELKALGKDTAEERVVFEERLSARYEELEDDEDTRAHLRSLLDDGDSSADD